MHRQQNMNTLVCIICIVYISFMGVHTSLTNNGLVCSDNDETNAQYCNLLEVIRPVEAIVACASSNRQDNWFAH